MSSQDHRLSSSPFASSPRQFSNDPATPLRGSDSRITGEASNSRDFNVAQPQMTQSGQGNDSPTSTLSESASFRFNDSASRSAFRTTFTPATNTPVKKTLLRSDPSILTVFDPADYELYDLWAPKN